MDENYWRISTHASIHHLFPIFIFSSVSKEVPSDKWTRIIGGYPHINLSFYIQFILREDSSCVWQDPKYEQARIWDFFKTKFLQYWMQDFENTWRGLSYLNAEVLIFFKNFITVNHTLYIKLWGGWSGYYKWSQKPWRHFCSPFLNIKR